MRIDFGSSGWVEIPRMNGGQGSVFAKMAVTENTRIVLTRIPPGSSIGLHRQASGDDVNYVLEGTGKAVCDGKEERLSPGVCHVCPKGSEHSIENDGSDDLVLFTAVPVTGARCRGWQGKRSSEPLPFFAGLLTAVHAIPSGGAGTPLPHSPALGCILGNGSVRSLTSRRASCSGSTHGLSRGPRSY
jgi:quercetin dioxygenase-like cupin family protein